MVTRLSPILKCNWGIPQPLLDLAAAAESAIAGPEEKIQSVCEFNFLKVLNAFREAGIRENHLHPSYGYGYFDAGREALDRCFASVFKGEEGLVRHQFVSGTHALRCALFGLLRPGDEVLALPNPPYDTLHPLFGLKPSPGSLAEWGISVRLASTEELLSGSILPGEKTKAIFIQRSKGYAWRDSLSISMIERISRKVKENSPGVWVVVDNCYGEFAEEREPCEAGADLVVGSLIKNPGGGLAHTGGYIVGRKDAVEQAAIQLTSPGLGREVGATLGSNRNFFTGFFLAPKFVGEALRTSVFAAELFHRLGYEVLPSPLEERTDSIQAIRLGTRQKALAFAKGIQSAGPIEQGAIPEGAPMAGYEDSIVMSGGSMIQGGSLELSCDLPLREPYNVYLQGGLSSVHGKLGVLLAAKAVLEI